MLTVVTAQRDKWLDAFNRSEQFQAEAQGHSMTVRLTHTEIRRIGALQVQQQQDHALDQFLTEQKTIYQETPKEELIETLLDRDRQLALEGRQLADGRIGGRLLREFVRGILQGLDSKDPQKVEEMLRGLGAEPADTRQLRLHGTTLGPDATQDNRDQTFGLATQIVEEASIHGGDE